MLYLSWDMHKNLANIFTCIQLFIGSLLFELDQQLRYRVSHAWKGRKTVIGVWLLSVHDDSLTICDDNRRRYTNHIHYWYVLGLHLLIPIYIYICVCILYKYVYTCDIYMGPFIKYVMLFWTNFDPLPHVTHCHTSCNP